MTVARVKLWGREIAAVSWQRDANTSAFEYAKSFLMSGIEIAPLMMPLSDTIYLFPELPEGTFKGLPGLLSDSLPDKFGNAVIDAWLATHGRSHEDFNPVDRLCYIASRGMGALEFEPAEGSSGDHSNPIDLDALVDLAGEILSGREHFKVRLEDANAMEDIMAVSASAGGARAKALIAWNPNSNEVRSGQVRAPQGFSHWLLKFDGVSGNRDREQTDDPKKYCLIEYAYHLMAVDAGIQMSECRILEKNGLHHFMTRRFDRLPDGGKLHMQSLCALGHFDFNADGAHSYEQALQVIRRLGLSMDSLEEQFRRMVFNIVARNQDDHTKNIAFLMDRSGRWSLSPAFDLIYSYNPKGIHTKTHQMSVNGKRERFIPDDLMACAKTAAISTSRARNIIHDVLAAVEKWPRFAGQAEVSARIAKKIGSDHRLYLRP